MDPGRKLFPGKRLGPLRSPMIGGTIRMPGTMDREDFGHAATAPVLCARGAVWENGRECGGFLGGGLF
eukprot:8579258-Pyramimonas_sp.AAC.1